MVLLRLMDIEIRGIMSGGARVLIHDAATGRTRAYQPGETLEGAVPLVFESISTNSIQFRDNAGFLHTKSF